MKPYSTGLRPVITGIGLEEQSPHDFAQIKPEGVQKHDQSKQTSMFSDAANLAFHGAPNFNNISGDYNVQVFESPAPVTIPGTIADKDHSASESESEIYVRLLLSKKNGYPIWYPSPMNSVPQEYREHGIRIGDVGIVSPRGQFDFLFNIMVGKDNPINQRGVPDGFVPISPPAGGWEVDLDEDYWIPGSNVMAGSVATANQSSGIDPLDPVQYTFRCMPREGAMLALPGGAVQEDLVNHGSFYTFAAKHAIDWYQYLNQRRDRAASNGSLYLVTGYDKTHVWGTASFSSVLTSDGFLLNYSSTDSGHKSRKYSHVWTQSGSATTRTGPPLQNRDEEGNRRQNQCIFVRGYKITLAETIWQKLLVGQVTVEHTRHSASAVPFSGPVKFGWKSFLPLNTLTKSGGPSDSSELQDNDLEEPTSPVVSSIVPQPSNSLHPSNVINQWLLDMDHKAFCAITHDSVWCSTIEGLNCVPDTLMLIELVERKYNIKAENGSLGVEAKSCPRSEMENFAYETNADEDGLAGGVNESLEKQNLNSPDLVEGLKLPNPPEESLNSFSSIEPDYNTPPSSAGSSPGLQSASLNQPSSPFISPLNIEDIDFTPWTNNNGEGKRSDSFLSTRAYPTQQSYYNPSSESKPNNEPVGSTVTGPIHPKSHLQRYGVSKPSVLLPPISPIPTSTEWDLPGMKNLGVNKGASIEPDRYSDEPLSNTFDHRVSTPIHSLPLAGTANRITVSGVPSVTAGDTHIAFGNAKTSSQRSYTPLKVLGDGSFGTVWLCEWHGTLPPNTPIPAMQNHARPEWAGKQLVAVKRLKRRWEGGWNECKQLAETQLLHALPQHTNIIRLYDAFVLPGTRELYYIFEPMEGNLYHLIKTRKGRPFAHGLIASISRQMVLSLNHIHSNGYVHRDVKPENFLVTTICRHDYPALSPLTDQIEGDVVAVIKLADFGHAKSLLSNQPYTEYVSIRWYRAPEVLLLSRDYSTPIDIWALGTILAELVNLRPLLPGADQVDQIHKIVEVLGSPQREVEAGDDPHEGGGLWPGGIRLANTVGFEFPSGRPRDLASLFDPSTLTSLIDMIRGLLKWDPGRRLTSQQCLEHAYFEETLPQLEFVTSSTSSS